MNQPFSSSICDRDRKRSSPELVKHQVVRVFDLDPGLSTLFTVFVAPSQLKNRLIKTGEHFRPNLSGNKKLRKYLKIYLRMFFAICLDKMQKTSWMSTPTSHIFGEKKHALEVLFVDYFVNGFLGVSLYWLISSTTQSFVGFIGSYGLDLTSIYTSISLYTTYI